MGIPTFEETAETPSEAGGASISGLPGSSPAMREIGLIPRSGSVGKLSNHDGPTDEAMFWKRCSPAELSRLLGIFQEEVESVYPFIEIKDVSSKAAEVLEAIDEMMNGGNGRRRDERELDLDRRRRGYSTDGYGDAAGSPYERGMRTSGGKEVTLKDIEMAKVAVATALVVEAQGKTELSTTMAESVERDVARFSRPEASLKDLQLMTMLVSNRMFNSGYHSTWTNRY